MIKSILEPYYRINQAAGVSINLLQNGDVIINACGVVIKDHQLDLEKKVANLNSVEELNKHFPAKTYVAINLIGKGILQKQVEKIEEVNQNNFNQILPNANFDDFYIQNFVSNNWSFISIIRKTEADKWLTRLKKLGIIPLMLSLGPFPVQNIVSQLNIYDTELVFDGHSIQRDDKREWIKYTYNEASLSTFPLKIESELINEKLIIAYSIAFQLVLAAKLNAIQASVNSLETDFKKCLADKKLQVRSFLILLVFFILLLINFFLFSWLNSTNIKLTDQVSRYAQSTNDIKGINDQVKDKEDLLKILGWDGGINKSNLIDQLASLLPGEISWREISINPIDMTASKAQRSLTFMDHKVKVSGFSENIIPVNEWIARIKTKKWVKTVQMDSYTYNNEFNTGQFIIIIEY